jgi:hypothetical protein
MLDVASVRCAAIGGELLGLVDYYETIFGRKDLVAKESEFRMKKLGLTLDLIRASRMPEEVSSGLHSAIISAWRLTVPERTKEDRLEESLRIVRSLNAIKKAVQWARDNPGTSSWWQLEMFVQFALPMSRFDLESEGVAQVHDLLDSAIGSIAPMIDGSPMFQSA